MFSLATIALIVSGISLITSVFVVPYVIVSFFIKLVLIAMVFGLVMYAIKRAFANR